MTKSGIVAEWLDTLRPGTHRELFEHLPHVMYFAKDVDLRLMAGNRSLVLRCGFEKEDDLIGHTDLDFHPIELAEKYAQDDQSILNSGQPMTGIVELFPNDLGELDWYVTDKYPLFSREGKVAGICGLIRSVRGTHKEVQPFMRLSPVTDYLEENFREKVTVAKLAQVAGMSVRQLELQFRDTFKTTPKQYIMKLRILKACELLSQSSLPITEIALEVGFYDHSSFTRKFSEMMNHTPREYRKRFSRSN
ncbi:AraC family transcriptional regulator [Roseibacillus ishigakijimensis]|uniref:AraC family transcriptional regulator n=1 Tax=Roseibacillus ishigakijimensis TaxID=454146 RepID=A0A934RRA7_9BACT|nr:AraC family transcriptional regulator [Roseibacillus ishigakijimensis]MBK1835510.1 AraC family transcriptional regulator [Roseibacillus ishigakijimensis]